jgi:hypothetical protein
VGGLAGDMGYAGRWNFLRGNEETIGKREKKNKKKLKKKKKEPK